MEDIIGKLGEALLMAFGMFWEVGWPLVPAYPLPSCFWAMWIPGCWLLAGLLYLGSGVGLAVVHLRRRLVG